MLTLNRSGGPWRDEIETGGFEVREIAGCEAAAIDQCDGRDHAVGCGHDMPMPRRSAHDPAVGQCGFLGQREDSVGKTMPPVGKPLFKPRGPLIGSDFSIP